MFSLRGRKNVKQWFVVIIYLHLSFAQEKIASKQQSEVIQRRCPYKLRKLWQTDISSFPFAASPLVTDIDGDGGLDIVTAPFCETFAVIEGETGKHLHDTGWPQHNLDKSVHSSPLQYDIDGDGMLDLLFLTSQGEGLFYNTHGHSLQKYTFQIQAAYIHSSWYKEGTTVTHMNIHQYVSTKEVSHHIPVDPHILGTAVLCNMTFLVIPISFFFSDDDYEDPSFIGPWGSADAKDKFFLAAVAVLDLQGLQAFKNKNSNKKSSEDYIHFFFLELSQSPIFNLFTPTVVDLDGTFGPPEIITGLTSGSLYVLSLQGEHRAEFPIRLKPISGRVAAADLDGRLGLELVVADTSGYVTCISSSSGQTLWSVEVGGSSFAGSQIVDLDLDGQLDIVIATDIGKVFAINGMNGTVLPKYPYKAGRRIAGHVLVTKFNPIRGPYDLVFLSDDGILHILAGDQSCLFQMALADTSFIDIVTQNVVLLSRGMEFIVATSDGSLICLGSGSESPVEEIIENEFKILHHRLAHPSDSVGQNNFVFSMNKPVILIDERTRYLREVTGSSFDLYFSIHGAERGYRFILCVYMGSDVVYEENIISNEVTPEPIKIQTPELPGEAQVTVVIADQFGFTYSDSIFLKFNQLILLDLQWLVLAPFTAMVIILLVNHGFPAKDLLPVTFPLKSK